MTCLRSNMDYEEITKSINILCSIHHYIKPLCDKEKEQKDLIAFMSNDPILN